MALTLFSRVGFYMCIYIYARTHARVVKPCNPAETYTAYSGFALNLLLDYILHRKLAEACSTQDA